MEIRSKLTAGVETLGQAFRSVRRTPGLSLTIIAVLALGLGANATMLETIDRLVMRAPPHFVEPESLTRLHHQYESRSAGVQTAHQFALSDMPAFERAASFSTVAGFYTEPLLLGRGESIEEVSSLLVTGTYWQTIGAAPALGRLFGPAEDVRGGEAVAVISHGLWRRNFGGSLDVLRQTIDFGHGPYSIIGVAPRGLADPHLQTVDLFLPLQVAGMQLRGEFLMDLPTSSWLELIARLAPGVSRSAAEAEATTRYAAVRAEVPRSAPVVSVIAGSVIVGRGPLAPDEAKVAWWLGGVALVVLIVASVNVANLLVVRSIRTRRESALRIALGISRPRLITQHLLEGVMLAAAGAAVALFINQWLGDAIRRILLPDVAWAEFGISRVLLVALGVLTLLVGLLTALPPALASARQAPGDALRGAAGGSPRGTAHARAGLTVLQAALSVVLLMGAGLFLRSLGNVHATDVGFDMKGLHTVRMVYDPGTTGAPEQQQLISAALDRLAMVPGVAAVAAAAGTPFGGAFGIPFRVPGVDSLPVAGTGGPYANAVTSDYFRVMGMTVVRGRGFNATDDAAGSRTAVLGESFARRIWPDHDPVGQCVQVGGDEAPCSTVVGIVADARVREMIGEGESFQFFIPAGQRQVSYLTPRIIVARVTDEGAVPLLRRELLALDPRVRHVAVRAFHDVVDPQLRSWTLGASLFSLFGLLALLVAALGLYSMIAFDVAQGARETGIRIALGASPTRILTAIIGRSAALASGGVIAGLIAVLWLAPSVEGMLHGISPYDPVTLVLSAGTLVVVGVLAALWPARRASKVDPVVALRME